MYVGHALLINLRPVAVPAPLLEKQAGAQSRESLGQTPGLTELRRRLIGDFRALVGRASVSGRVKGERELAPPVLELGFVSWKVLLAEGGIRNLGAEFVLRRR